MIPKEFFITSGKATSPVSELNAFDLALKKAGIAQCNLVPVSSILPPGCKERKWRKIAAGAITHAVIARMDGDEGTTIGAGIAWAWENDRKFGLVAEAHGYMDLKALRETLEWKIKEMAKIREIEIDKISYRTEVLRVPMDNYGCVIATLVYTL
ncbi:MAG: pyruvoyl-dependent arginine decarboxylase [Candidatus Bathyarchaeota archaeon]|nr:pyruvoyl-dependent arginine decarboxylase [Candidatus Bathyarchaeota archaeon]MDH5419518.1 pyruvoyl-dependent arginine decarboxylase [Candidatus Bathyarchaeota archaeon]MDH5701917.1 pyruvoyl-dependent arginine decarboxylase [Candidatus Bathyarchaeota archaeon]